MIRVRNAWINFCCFPRLTAIWTRPAVAPINKSRWYHIYITFWNFPKGNSTYSSNGSPRSFTEIFCFKFFILENVLSKQIPQQLLKRWLWTLNAVHPTILRAIACFVLSFWSRLFERKLFVVLITWSRELFKNAASMSDVIPCASLLNRKTALWRCTW